MAETEKITVNLGVVDLGKIDLLVDQGVYSNRTDLIRTAIRNQIEQHASIVQQTVTRRAMVVGVLVYTRSGLEKVRTRGEQLEIKVLGMLILQGDVTAELASETIRSIEVLGAIRMAPAVREALADRVWPR